MHTFGIYAASPLRGRARKGQSLVRKCRSTGVKLLVSAVLRFLAFFKIINVSLKRPALKVMGAVSSVSVRAMSTFRSVGDSLKNERTSVNSLPLHQRCGASVKSSQFQVTWTRKVREGEAL